MKTIQINLSDLGNRIINIGRVGENLYTQVKINAISVFDDYPNAVATMVVSPPGGESYPGTITREGIMLIWNLTASDLIHNGSGRIQLTFTNGDEVIKTAIGETSCLESLNPDGEVPEPIENWLTEAAEALENINSKLPRPAAGDGEDGQVLISNGDGTTRWEDYGLPTDEQTQEAIDNWMDDHPEASTTVQDGAITKAKLNASLKAELLVPSFVLLSDGTYSMNFVGLT